MHDYLGRVYANQAIASPVDQGTTQSWQHGVHISALM